MLRCLGAILRGFVGLGPYYVRICFPAGLFCFPSPLKPDSQTAIKQGSPQAGRQASKQARKRPETPVYPKHKTTYPTPTPTHLKPTLDHFGSYRDRSLLRSCTNCDIMADAMRKKTTHWEEEDAKENDRVTQSFMKSDQVLRLQDRTARGTFQSKHCSNYCMRGRNMSRLSRPTGTTCTRSTPR